MSLKSIGFGTSQLLKTALALTALLTTANAEEDPRKPAAITAQDVPVVPAEIFAKLNQYQSVRGAAFRGFSPDGNGILINTRFGNSSQLHRVYMPGGRREQITFYQEPVTGRFVPDSREGLILLSMDSGGNENTQIYLLNSKKYATDLLTDGKSRNLLGAVSNDGSKLVISSNQRNGRDSDLYLADPLVAGSMKLLMQVEKQTWSAYDWSPDGKSVLVSQFVSANESYPAILDVSTGMRTSIPLPTTEKASVGQMAFSPDGQSVLMTTDANGEFNRLVRYDLATKTSKGLMDDLNWDVSELQVDHHSGKVAVAINEDGASRLFVFSPSGQRRELALPLGIVSGLDFSPDGKLLGMTLARPDAPPDAYSIQLETGNLTRWTFSEVGGLNPESFVTPTRIRFPSFDERMIPAYYFKPRQSQKSTSTNAAPASTKLPVLISIHGGPESQYQPFFAPIFQYYVNELGVAVICPNVRGSAGYGKTYLKLDNAEKREDSVRDIGALLDWIEKQPELDASRVAVTGGSYGGYMVLASLTHFGDRIRAGIDIVGIANFITFLEKTAGYRVDLRRAEYGDERDPQMRSTFEKISPLNNAEKIRSALLVIHGKNDPRVPFHEAEQISNKVRSSGRPVWTVFADNEGHGFAKKDNSDYQRAVEVLFLKKSLELDDK